MAIPRRRAILVSHGQPSDPEPAEAALAAQKPELPGWSVLTATLAMPGALEKTLQMGPEPVIYPMFMTDGWFVKTALRKRLAGVSCRVLPPLGAEPALPAMVAGVLQDTLKQQGWEGGETTLLITAHGSGRSPDAARDTYGFVERLAQHIHFAGVETGFVEQQPLLAEAVARCPPRAICLPFFAAYGGHVREDLAEALENAGFTGPCLDPVGVMQGITALIAKSLSGAD